MHRTQGLFSSPVNQFVPTTGLRIHFSGNVYQDFKRRLLYIREISPTIVAMALRTPSAECTLKTRGFKSLSSSPIPSTVSSNLSDWGCPCTCGRATIVRCELGAGRDSYRR